MIQAANHSQIQNSYQLNYSSLNVSYKSVSMNNGQNQTAGIHYILDLGSSRRQNADYGIRDILDLGSMRGMKADYASVLAMVEDKVNGKLAERLEKAGLTQAASNDYWSPENTAQRIVDFALNFYDAYAQRNGGKSEETLDAFLEIVRGAIDEGISQAKAIISDFTDGEVPKENLDIISQTREHIETLLNGFRESQSAYLSELLNA